jgi:hypothetical protein
MIMNQLLNQYAKHLFVFIGFIVLSLGYFSPVLQGKKIFQSDIVQYTGMAKQHIDFRLDQGKETYWTNSAFGGMPTYQLGAKYPHNYIKKLDLTLRFLPRPADYLLLYFLGFYLLLLVLKQDFRVAVLGALAFGFSTYLIIILGVGHNAKAHAIAYMPFVLSGVLLVYQKRYWVGFIMTTIASALEIVTNHPQMTYYLLFVLLFLAVSYLIKAIKAHDISSFFRSSLILICSAILALGMNASNLLSTKEYVAESTRSQSELTVLSDGYERPESSGLDRAYITQFSYGVTESFNLLIPRFMGGGSTEELDTDSKTYKAYKALGATALQARNEIKQAPMYWGDQPIVEAPAYVGATLLFLFLLDLFVYKGQHKWWLISAIVLSLLLSFGKNLSFLTNFFIDYVPLYNKFRAVSSIQVILELCIPVFAMLGLSKFLSDDLSDSKKLKALKYTAFSLVGLTTIFLLFKNSLFDFVGLRDGQYQNFYGIDFVKALREDRRNLFTADVLRTLFFILAAASCLWFYIHQKITKNIAFMILAVLLVIDLAAVDLRYVNDDDFVSAIKVDKPFTATSIDKEILKDSTVFRVYDASDGSTRSSYFHNAIGGYHAAKMRRFNEVMDFHIDKGNPEVFNMLNTKYIIYNNDNEQLQYLENDEVNGNAWFINNLISVSDADAEILALDTLKTKFSAVINKNIHSGHSFVLDSTASIELIDYLPNKLVYKSSNANDGFAVFSENYYKHGWQVTIDGQEVPHYNVNYILRGLEVPKGNHTIVFEFDPEVVRNGSSIALMSSILFLILMGIFSFLFIKKYK